MYYPKPRHGWWCNARTFPTRCRYCGKKVYYFFCDCGSKVFFDSLGLPWHKHNCTERDLNLDRIHKQIPGSIEEDYKKHIVERQEYRSRAEVEVPIRACIPEKDGQNVYEKGVIRDVLPELDVYKKFNVPKDSLFGIKFLKELSSGSWMQVTIYVDDLGSDAIDSYTMLIRTDEWDRAEVKQGDLVSFEIEGRHFPGSDHYWLCKEILLL